MTFRFGTLVAASLCVALGAALGGCRSGEVESGLFVTIELDPGLSSKCVQLVARVGGTERRSGAIDLTTVTGSKAAVGVAQGDLPDVITLQAIGFSDTTCRTVTTPAEGSLSTEARFVRNAKATPVTLRLRREVTTGEDCANGLDDDDDQLVDCADSDCDRKACSLGNACVVGQHCEGGACGGGSAKACTTPPSGCYAATGNCEAPAGDCVYGVRFTAPCDDNDPCTVSDSCDTTGACRGVKKTCDAPPAQCYAPVGTCQADGGCAYALTEGGACSDQNNCTINDTCSSTGACSGVQVLCSAKPCAVYSNACDGDGGCLYTPADAGAGCSGGVCNAAGDCIATFPYVPSNFVEAQVPALPAVATELNCGETVIDTSTLPPTVTNWCVAGTPEFGSALISQPGEQPLMLLSFRSLHVGPASTLRFKGTRAAALAVTGAVTIDGVVVTEAGPRTCAAGSGGSGDSTLAGNGGAGGAGFGTAGGNGAKGSLGAVNGGSGGAVNGEARLVPLRGGCSGGAGGGNTLRVGAGGGALQISAAGTLTLANTIAAPGRGGAGGPGAALVVIGGNGAGSGGALLLEASNVVLTAAARLTANGGSGGEAGDGTGNTGSSGVSGSADSATPAVGGSGSSLGGAGGDGAAGAVPAGAGGSDSGGGGGGLGRVRLNSVLGCSINGSAVMSPTPTSAQPDAGCP